MDQFQRNVLLHDTPCAVADRAEGVVVKYPPDDGFVVTAYLTDELKAGETIWPTK